jgi:hypothetical protein
MNTNLERLQAHYADRTHQSLSSAGRTEFFSKDSFANKLDRLRAIALGGSRSSSHREKGCV